MVLTLADTFYAEVKRGKIFLKMNVIISVKCTE